MPSGALVEADVILRQLLEGIALENRKQTLILAKLLALQAPTEAADWLNQIADEATAGGTL